MGKYACNGPGRPKGSKNVVDAELKKKILQSWDRNEGDVILDDFILGGKKWFNAYLGHIVSLVKGNNHKNPDSIPVTNVVVVVKGQGKEVKVATKRRGTGKNHRIRVD